jgi:hypothetical protein
LTKIASEGRFEEYTHGRGNLVPPRGNALNAGISALVDLIDDTDGAPERTYELLRAAIDRLDSAGVPVRDKRIYREGAVAMGLRHLTSYLREHTTSKRVFIEGEPPLVWPSPRGETTTRTPLLAPAPGS